MSCTSCASSNQGEFAAEVNIHLRGLHNLDKPSVLVFPNIVVCLDCGFTAFTIQQAGLAILASGTRATEGPGQQEKIGQIALIA